MNSCGSRLLGQLCGGGLDRKATDGGLIESRVGKRDTPGRSGGFVRSNGWEPRSRWATTTRRGQPALQPVGCVWYASYKLGIAMGRDW